MAATVPFDPYNQTFTLQTSSGSLVNVTIPDLDYFVQYNNQICINYGAQIGASLVLFVVLLLLTKPGKRSTSIFIVNALSLALNVVRNVLLCLYYTGHFTEAYAYFAGDYSRITNGDYATSVTATVFNVLVMVCVEISLCLQTRVVCVTLRQLYRRSIFAFSILIALVAFASRMAFCIANSIYIVQLSNTYPLHWLASASNITLSISICWFCSVFVTKLGFALNLRRKLGLGQFGPMQIIFIMGCQTLIIPALFSILQYFVPNPALGSNVLSSVAVFLPLSSLWASASVDSRFQATKKHQYSAKIGSSYPAGSSGRLNPLSGPLSPTNTDTTNISGSDPFSPHNASQGHVFQDLEAQGMAGSSDTGNRG